MRKIIYQKPHVIVRIINSEELLQIGINSQDDPVPGDEADAKNLDFGDDDYNIKHSDDIWED